jgi:hypothetical protein
MSRKPRTHSTAYRCGWRDGRYEEPCCFTDNHRLASLKATSDRLDYYRGHRAGRETRLRDDGHLLGSSCTLLPPHYRTGAAGLGMLYQS